MIPLPGDFRARMGDVFGDDGRAWLDRLPRIIAEYAARWDVVIDEPFPLSYNFVAPATRADGTPAVFKAGVPREQIACEIAALRHWDGDGAVRVLESDAEAGVFLIERAFPGSLLIDLPDDAAASRIAAAVMRRLASHGPAAHPFPAVAGWARALRELRARYGAGTGPLDPRTFARAEALFPELIATQEAPILLHGDLHHWNVLSAGSDRWVAIDPHGVVAEPAFEVATWMRNPYNAGTPMPQDASALVYLSRQPDARRVLARRLDIFNEALGIDRERLRLWSVAHAVLSACWSDEAAHTENSLDAMAVAAMIDGLR